MPPESVAAVTVIALFVSVVGAQRSSDALKRVLHSAGDVDRIWRPVTGVNKISCPAGGIPRDATGPAVEYVRIRADQAHKPLLDSSS